MDKFLIVLCALFAITLATVAFPEGAVVVLIVGLCSLVTIILIRRYTDNSKFLTRVFLAALLLRMLLGAAIYFFNLYEFFGPDAIVYDLWGQRLLEIWYGRADMYDPLTQQLIKMNYPGWGMQYLTAVIYLVAGQSMLAVQSLCAVVGAATAPMIYVCARNIYVNQRVAKISALAIAFFPSFIVWSAQMLKDGLMIFLLVVTMTMVLYLQKKFSYLTLAVLILSLFGIYSLRFYIFYMAAAAVAGSLVIGVSTTSQSLIRRGIAIFIIGLALAYLGVVQNSALEFERFGSVDRLQISREAASRQTGSGFVDEDSKADVSTFEGAMTVLPIGLMYLMLAPFPWQVSNFRQAITLPEILLWWALIPLAISGLWYTLKHRLREAIPILTFTLMLTLVYALYQGNVGTAYRQRTQIQVFLFIFIAVGWSLIQEKKENRKFLRDKRKQQLRKFA